MTTLPLLPLRDVVVFPNMVLPLFVGRTKSIHALQLASESEEKQIMLVAQKVPTQDELGVEDLHSVGCVATLLQSLKLPDGTIKVLVEGSYRARVIAAKEEDSHFEATIEKVDSFVEETPELEALRRTLITEFEQYLKLNKKIPPEILGSLSQIDDANQLVDTILMHLPLKIEQKQEMLEQLDVAKRFENTIALLEVEIDILQVEKRIRGRVKRQMEKSQREYYLNEQVKAIQKELGRSEDGTDFDELETKIKAAQMPREARDKAESELKKLRMMSPMSAEANVVSNYIEALLALPWKKKSKINKDLKKAEEVLETDHYGLEKVKERILEYLAVQQRVDIVKAPILCLVGPPGVGKTSLGQSIARATNREFVRMALGGVRDEAEIRGHRRTYIGSMPGKILQNMTKVKVKNPLFLLDEVDKLGADFRGDPASALLEVLDPEQNHTFVDHYVEVEYDLSEVMFVATANTLNIPAALLDRMEIIRLSGYTELEKISIAKNYLVTKQIKSNGLKSQEIEIEESALVSIVRYYTREAGVRSLDREIAKICRKVVRELMISESERKRALRRKAENKPERLALPIKVNAENIEKYLGVKRYTFGLAEKENQIGQVTGLAWTEVGGELLTIECALMPGKGKMINTGKLGNVMQESIQTALSVVRTRAKALGIVDDFYQKNDIHIHLPEGATPKDGPSAGIGICTAIVSVLTNIPVRADVAMTGEITLRGEVLPIGGLKEKLLAAQRGGIKIVLIPEENVKDLAEIPDNIKGTLDLRPVKWFDQVLEIALEVNPKTICQQKEETELEDVVISQQSVVSNEELNSTNVTKH